MTTYAFRIVNVFARDGRLTGNPLCVFEDGKGLDEAAMQALARQFNLSETTFILPSDKASARVRIFTPAYEMPFAGHPTLGTAHVVRSLGGGDRVVLEMKAGLIPVAAQGDRWTLTANRARSRAVAEDAAALARTVGLEASDIGESPLWMNAGTEQLMLPVRSRDAVRRALPRPDAFLALRSEDTPGKTYVFFDSAGEGEVEARFFFPSATAILEDPATGSACANLGGWFATRQPGRRVERIVLQGDAVKRPSTLRLLVKEDGEVQVGGDVVELGRGTVSL
jgi:trans-2,3-dihydro-3-hydroxyanthranilate isomerase